MNKRVIDTALLHTRSDQTIQVDVFSGHRMSVKRNVRDILTRNGMTLGVVSIDYIDYAVRQIGKTTEWYFCDADGRRVHREFDKYNADWKINAAKLHAKHQRRGNETSSEG